MESEEKIENIEEEFNAIQSLFNEGKKHLVGKNKNIKSAIEIYDKYYSKLNEIYENLKDKSKSTDKIYISHLIRLN